MEVALDLTLPQRTVALPPTKASRRPLPGDDELSRLVESYASMPQSFAQDAGVFHGADLSIGWKVLSRGHVVDLFPLELEATRLEGTGCQIRLEVPSLVLPHCVTVSCTGPDFVADFLTESGSLYTVTIPHACFREASAAVQKDLTIRLRPLDLSTTPRILKSVSAETLLLALSDGNLLRIDRASPQEVAVNATALANPFKQSSGWGIFRSANTVPGHPHLSIDAASSIDVLETEQLAVVYCVNNAVQTWSLTQNECLQLIPPPGGPFRLRPTNYVAHSGRRVAVAYPEALELFDVAGGQLALHRKQSVPDHLRSWFVVSVSIFYDDSPAQSSDGSVLLAFKHDMRAEMYKVLEGRWMRVGGYDNRGLLDLPQTSPAQTRASLLEVDREILRLALDQLGLESLDDLEQSQKKMLRLDALCREIVSQGREMLVLAPALSMKAEMFMWSFRVSGLTFFGISEDESSVPEGGQAATDFADTLLSSVPESVLADIGDLMLSNELLLVERIEKVLGLLKGHVDQLELNEMGRTSASDVAQSIQQYVENFGPQATSETVTDARPPLALSELGREAVSMLVHNYASTYTTNFRSVVALAAIGLADGWLNSCGDSDLLLAVVEVLRRLAFIREIGLKNLSVGAGDITLADFGLGLARRLAHDCEPVKVISRLITAKPVAVSGVVASVLRAAAVCESTPEIVLLRGLAKIAMQDSEGEALVKRVSLLRPWPLSADRPQDQAEFLFRVAKFAHANRADAVALRLARLSEGLATSNSGAVHELIFELALRSGDYAVGYSALVRRFSTIRESQSEQALADKWIHDLVTVAAQQPEAVRELVVAYPFIGFAKSLQKTLASSASFATVPAYKLRYTWHVARDDYLGAARVIFEQLAESSVQDSRRLDLYTICLNALALVAPDARWLNIGDTVVHYDDIRLQQDELEARLKHV